MSNVQPTRRPEVEAVLVSIERLKWGVLAEFRGSRADLIASGVAEREYFENLSKSGGRAASTQFADRFEVRRRSGGIFELTLFLRHTPWYGDDGDPMTDKRVRRSKFWRDHGADIERFVAQAIERARSRRALGGAS